MSDADNYAKGEQPERWSPPATIDDRDAALITIRSIAMDPSVSIDRMRELLEMERQIRGERQRGAFVAAMAAVQALIPQIVKNAENTDNKSQYVTLDAIGAGIDQIIAEHGLVLTFSPETSPLPNCLRINATLSHVSGFEREYHADVPIDAAGAKGNVNKTPTHAWGSTVTYGRRYLTMMIFNVKSRRAMPDDDGNAAGRGETVNPEQLADINALIDETKTDVAGVLDAYKVAELGALSQVQFGDLRARLMIKRNQQRKATASASKS